MNIMDIKLNKVTGKCDEKCLFKYKYHNSNCVASNDTTKFILSYDDNPKSPVTFNNIEYSVESVYLYFKSVHKFNGDTSDGEIIINHKPSSGGGKRLMVCLPISKSSGFPSNLLNNILNKITFIQPGNSDNITLDVDYNLNDIVKYDPYFYYYDDNGMNYICYGLSNAIYVSDKLIQGIKNILADPLSTEMCPSVSYLYYNKQGPSKYDGDEIYIDCNPVNSSGTEQILINDNNNINGNITAPKLPQNFTLLEIIGIFLFIVCLYVAGTNIYNKIKTTFNGKSKLPYISSRLSKYSDSQKYENNLELFEELLQYLLNQNKALNPDLNTT